MCHPAKNKGTILNKRRYSEHKHSKPQANRLSRLFCAFWKPKAWIEDASYILRFSSNESILNRIGGLANRWFTVDSGKSVLQINTRLHLT